MSEKTTSMSLGDISDECLEVPTEKCVSLIYKWYKSRSDIKYDDNQPSIDPKKMLEFMNFQYSKNS